MILCNLYCVRICVSSLGLIPISSSCRVECWIWIFFL